MRAEHPTGWSDAAFAVAALLLPLVLLVPVLRLDQADLAVPLDYDGDALFSASLVQNLAETGAWAETPRLAAPEGLRLLRLLVWLTGSWAVAFNLFYVVSFPLASLSAFLVFRALGFSRGPSLVSAVLFAFLPYHFLKGARHLSLASYCSLASYWMVPPALLLALRLWTGRRMFPPRAAGGTAAAAVLLLCVASGPVYYALFGAMVLGVSGMVAALRDRTARPVVETALALALVGVTLAAHLAPSLAWRLEHGENVGVARRPTEAQIFALQIAPMVLPVADHRIPFLADARAAWNRSSPGAGVNHAEWSSLGSIGTVGFLLLLAAAVGVFPGAGRGRQLLRAAGGLTVALLVIASTGGFGSLFAFALPEIRVYARLGLLIAFLSLLAVTWLVERALEGRGRRTATAILASILVVGVADQTNPAAVPDHAGLRSTRRSDLSFFGAIEARLAPGAMVYQLPWVSFPEARPVNGMSCSDPIRAYLSTERVRWSHGAVRGRPGAAWRKEISSLPIPRLVAAVSARGFDGIVVDRAGTADAGRSIEESLAALLGAPLVSPDGRFSFFRTHGREASAREAPGLRRFASNDSRGSSERRSGP